MKCTKCSKEATHSIQVRNEPSAKTPSADKKVDKDPFYIYGFCDEDWGELMKWLNG